MTFGEMQTDLAALLGTDMNYYRGDPVLDSATFTVATERKRLLNWAYRTTTKLCHIVEPALTFEPLEDVAFYRYQDPPGRTQIVDLGGATGGNFTLSVQYGGSTTTTAAIDWNDSASDVQTALNNLANIASATVTLVEYGYKVVFSGADVPPIPVMNMTSSLTGTTWTPAVRQAGFGKRVVKLFRLFLDDTVMKDQFGRPGLYNKNAFERRYRGWRSQSSGTPVIAVDRGDRIQLHYKPDDDFLTASAGNNFAEAQILHDDLIDDDDVPELDEETHEGIVLLASFRAADPVTDEDGALRRIQSANSRWWKEVLEIRRRNTNAQFDTSGTFIPGGMRALT